MALVDEAVETEVLAVFPAPSRRRLGLEQLLIAAGQVGAGAGNLVFTLVAARLLTPGAFAQLSVFLGLYLVLSLPATSLSAATALQPARRDVLVRRVAVASVMLALFGAACSPLLGPVLHLPTIMVLVLAAVVPAAAGLALERGRLYGRQSHGQVVASLVAEPIVRLSAGVILAAWSGAIGGAEGVVLAAYLALEVARPRRLARRHPRLLRQIDEANDSPPPARPRMSGVGWTAGAFALLAVAQNQDLVFANATLGGSRAGLYAALSTLGGAAAFATITVPMVLIPQAVHGDRRSLGVAVAVAAGIGAVAVAVGALGSGLLVRDMFGARYSPVGHLVGPYLAAMGLLGVSRVLVAERCATGRARRMTLLLGAAAAGQLAGMIAFGDRVANIAIVTLVAMSALTVALGTERLVERIHPGAPLLGARAWLRARLETRHVRVVAAAVVVGLVVRLIVWRGLWLDEATSVYQAHMSYSGMISNLRDTDVHPPLYFTLLWATVHVLGYGSMVVRIPSIVAGLLVIPALYLAARDLWGRRSGVIAAVFASVAPFLVWYSQEIRMYSLFMLFAALAMWGQVRAIRRGGVGDWCIFVGASAGLAWTEYFGLFQVLAQQLFFVWLFARHREHRPRMLGWLLATLALLALVAPLAPFAWHQFLVNQNAGKGFGAPSQTSLAGTQSLSVYTVLANLAWSVVGYHSAAMMEALVALWPLGILATLFVLGRKANWTTKLVLFTAVIPAALLLAAGTQKRFLYDVRYMSGVAIALLLLVARMVTGSTRSRRMQAVGCVAIVGVLFAGLMDEQFNGTNPRLYDFAGAVRGIAQHWRPGDVVVYSPTSLQQVLDYYAPHERKEAAALGPPVVPEGDSIYVLASPNLMTGQEPQQLGSLLVQLRRVDIPTGVSHRSNVTVWSFLVPAQPPASPAAAPGPGSAGTWSRP